jgi:hypothetical protein
MVAPGSGGIQASGPSCWREEFSVELHESTVGKLLRKLSFQHMSVRPQHPQSKPDEQEVFSASFLLL